MFFTCVALQNIIAMWDGKDEWAEKGVSWDKKDGLFDDDDEDQVNWARPKVLRKGQWVKVNPGEDYSSIGRVGFSQQHQVVWGEADGPMPTGPDDLQQLVALHTETDVKFRALQTKLVKNYCERLKAKELYWMRS